MLQYEDVCTVLPVRTFNHYSALFVYGDQVRCNKLFDFVLSFTFKHIELNLIDKKISVYF